MDAYLDFLQLSSKIFDYIEAFSNNQRVAYPYDECIKFISTLNNSVGNVKNIIDDITINYKYLLFPNLLQINEKYKHLSSLIKFIIIYSRIMSIDRNE